MAAGILEELVGMTDRLALFDTHEHIERDSAGRYYGSDLFDLIQNTFYLWSDLISSGMPPQLWDSDEKDDEKKWILLRHWLPNVVGSGYYRGIVRGLQALHGMEDSTIDDSNWRHLNESIHTAYEDPEWTVKVLREKTHIRWAINDVDGFNMDRSIFLPSLKFDYLLGGGSPAGRERIKQLDGVDLGTFGEYQQFLDRKLTEFKALGAVALKTVTPYYRGFNYEPVSPGDASRAYWVEGDPTQEQKKIVEDFAFHFVIRKAIDLDLPVQIHTGILAWNTTYLPHCNPTALNRLFVQYPECRFVLFHGGYPYADELGILVKTFPNVFLDLCWMPWISQAVTKHFLDMWLELVPSNKIMWGGDAHRAECIHGHWLLARQVVCEVLNNKVASGALQPTDAVRIAVGIFRDNAQAFFHIL
jgi:hypothetical protein